jgi:dihydroneopterin aldolase
MYKVFAENIKIYSASGVYSGEKKVENIFSVNIILQFKILPVNPLDYEMLISTVHHCAKQDFEWMEDLANRIFESLSKKMDQPCQAVINIKKISPAFLNFHSEAVGIELSREFP